MLIYRIKASDIQGFQDPYKLRLEVLPALAELDNQKNKSIYNQYFK